MKNIREKIKRQTEILGLVINNPSSFDMNYFENLFNINNSTLKKDLKELRSSGIDIHSTKNKGIILLNDFPKETIKNIVNQYIGIAVTNSSYDHASNLLVQKLHKHSIAFITTIQLSIEKHYKIKIEYSKPETNKIEIREVEPYCIFQSDKNWRLLANHEGIIKQFLINRIKSIEQLDIKFKQVSKKKIDEIFSTSFKSWIGTEKYNIKIKFLPPWTERIKIQQLMEIEKVIENKDGSVIYETVVNSLSEIASWVVSRGEGVIVLEPEELKNIVITTAKGTLKNY